MVHSPAKVRVRSRGSVQVVNGLTMGLGQVSLIGGGGVTLVGSGCWVRPMAGVRSGPKPGKSAQVQHGVRPRVDPLPLLAGGIGTGAVVGVAS